MVLKFLKNRGAKLFKSSEGKNLDHKLGISNKNNEEIPFYFLDNYMIEKSSAGIRLKISAKKNQVDLIYKLSDCLNPPFYVLYILIESRLGNSLGRYQSPLIESKNDLKIFLDKYKNYFESDARHHVWLGTINNSGKLIYDLHNLIFAYGPNEKYIQILKQKGFKQKDFKIPNPHDHIFNPENDKYEDLIINHWDWVYFELKEQDKY
jgi:hypothetical protein